MGFDPYKKEFAEGDFVVSASGDYEQYAIHEVYRVKKGFTLTDLPLKQSSPVNTNPYGKRRMEYVRDLTDEFISDHLEVVECGELDYCGVYTDEGDS